MTDSKPKEVEEVDRIILNGMGGSGNNNGWDKVNPKYLTRSRKRWLKTLPERDHWCRR